MNEKSLSALYRRLTASAPVSPDTEAIAAAADPSGVDTDLSVTQAIAGSEVSAKLVRMLAALRSDSETLASDVARTRRHVAHRRDLRTDRRVAASRPQRRHGALRWATALAACLVAAVGLFTLHRDHVAPPAVAQQHVVADVIFSTRDTIFRVGMESPHSQASAPTRGDKVFHADFGNGS
jgi:hypothetical protein